MSPVTTTILIYILLVYLVVICLKFLKKKTVYIYMYKHTQLLEYLQMEGLVELGRPAVVLGFGLEFAFLVAEVRPNHGDLHKGSEHARSLPFQVTGSHN